MPNMVRPSTVIVSNIPNTTSEGHIKITLELNINLNSNGIEANVVAMKAKETEKEATTEEKDEFQFAIPDFNSQDKVNFGKNVD